MTEHHRASRPRRLVAALAVAAATAAGCGIPADDEPRAISQEQLPDGDDDSVDNAAGGATDNATVYFTRFDGDRTLIVPVEVPVPVEAATSTPDPATVLETLLIGRPEDLAAAEGLQTKIPPDTALASPPVLQPDGTLDVDLTSGIFATQADGARLAYGQIACTADALAGVEAVRFRVEGGALQAPDGEGQSTELPVTCDSYANLLAPPAG
jgi:spore germination protein GerM